MSIQSQAHEATYESADSYGRFEGCFRDHRDRPFRFKDQIRSIRHACEETDAQGLVVQTGLVAASLPNSTINLDAGAIPDLYAFYESSYDSNIGLKSAEPWYPSSWAQELQLPLETPVLATNPADDVRLYLAAVKEKQSSDIIDKWLPLSTTRDDKDEGLAFPQSSARFQSLLYREFDHECVSTSKDALVLVEEVQNICRPLTPEDRLPPFHKLYAVPVTPPLSPVSDSPSEYIPDAAACHFDLTSEPPSPYNIGSESIQNVIVKEQIDSGTALTEYGFETSQSPALCLPNDESGICLSALKLDLPVVAEVSSPGEVNVAEAAFEHTVSSSTANDANEDREMNFESFFDKAFVEVLDTHRSMANEAVEQEKYDPVDSFARVSVPLMDFSLPSLDWESHTSDSRSHFFWLRNRSSEPFSFPIAVIDKSMESSMKWVPYPQGQGRGRLKILGEEFGLISAASQSLLHPHLAGALSSSDFVPQSGTLAVLAIRNDEEIECEPGIECQTVVSPFFQVRRQPPVEIQHVLELQFPEPSGSSLMDLVRRRATEEGRGIAIGDAAGSLKDDQILHTGRLLSSFMEMRAVKRARLNSRILDAKSTEARTLSHSSHSAPSLASSVIETPESTKHIVQRPAPAPEITIPDDKASFIVSVDLARSLFSHLEEVWPPDRLVDRSLSLNDYSRYSSKDSKQAGDASQQMSCDADIALTAAVGVILTSLPKARQRPLPGSDSLPQLRERIVQVSIKYERLFVLVSEMNSSGEFIGTSSPSDLAAYADFVRFTTGLEAGITACLVPGAYETTARWVLALMCQFSSSALITSRFISASETTWELFFRHAGMNIAAAQVLSGTLFEEAGNQGLAHFLAMSKQDRLARYARLLGGEKLLLRVGRVLDHPWS